MDVIDVIVHPLTSLVVGIAGIVVSIWFYLRGRQTKRIFYRVSEPRNRVRTPDGTVVHVALWNGGSLPVVADDVPEPLRIGATAGGRLARTTVLAETNEYSNVSVARTTGSDAEVNFKYLNAGDGALLELAFEDQDSPELVGRGAVIGGEGPTLRGGSSASRVLAILLPPLVLSWAFVFVGLGSDDPGVRFGLCFLGVVFYPAVVGPALTLIKRAEMPASLHQELERVPSTV